VPKQQASKKRAKVAYKPPQVGDICYVRKSYGEWSSGTQVVIMNVSSSGDSATVEHESTHEEFDIPVDFLVRKRKRPR
jgi:hypothetical protein